MTKVSIIIPLYRINPKFNECMDSLRRTTDPKEVEIIVMRTSGSFAHNCNRGIMAAKGKYICLLNDDTTTTDGWLEPLVELMEKDNKIAAVSPMMMFPTQPMRIQFGGMIFHDDYCGGHLHWNKTLAYPHFISKPHEFQATTFGCVLLRSEALFDIELPSSQIIDEAYKVGGYEDIDTCFRLKLAGWKIFYQPESMIFHDESSTFNSMDQILRKNASSENRKLYLSKWTKYFEDGTFKVDDKDYPEGLDNYVSNKERY